MIIPLRLDRDITARLDDAWKSHGIRSRMAFFRDAAAHYLAHLGETDVASLFQGAEDEMPA